ncbi:MAG: double zinc ribbon domain-containing protein, partial [Desulfarculaceae bacterium]
MNMSLPYLARALKDLAFPLICLGCGDSVSTENPFCPRCQNQIHMITGPVCSRCGKPKAVAAGSRLCSQCSS